MSALDIEAIRARVMAAAPGPWEASERDVVIAVVVGGGDVVKICCDNLGLGDGALTCQVADLIVHAPDDLRALCDEVKRLRQVERAAKAWDDWDGPNKDEIRRVPRAAILEDLDRLCFWRVPYQTHETGPVRYLWESRDGLHELEVLLAREGERPTCRDILDAAKGVGFVEKVSPVLVLARWFSKMGGDAK